MSSFNDHQTNGYRESGLGGRNRQNPSLTRSAINMHYRLLKDLLMLIYVSCSWLVSGQVWAFCNIQGSSANLERPACLVISPFRKQAGRRIYKTERTKQGNVLMQRYWSACNSTFWVVNRRSFSPGGQCDSSAEAMCQLKSVRSERVGGWERHANDDATVFPVRMSHLSVRELTSTAWAPYHTRAHAHTSHCSEMNTYIVSICSHTTHVHTHKHASILNNELGLSAKT